MTTRQATLDDDTIFALQTALATVKSAMDQVWTYYASIGRQSSDLFEFQYSKTDEHGFIPVDQIREMFVEGAGGEENWKKIADVSGVYNRERDIIVPDYIVDGKLNMRKHLISWTLTASMTMEKKMEWAFKLTDANKDGYLDQG